MSPAEEIARTTRRMNALERVVAPRLEAERARISLLAVSVAAARACPADHGTGSRSQILIEARSMVPRNV